jgi:AcrR family transcriptional regulator
VVRRKSPRLSADPDAARKLLLSAAEQCFERYGVAKTTMDDIAKAGGVSRPTLYRYFSDRESIILAVVAARSRLLGAAAVRYIARQPTLEAKLVDGLLYIVDRGRKDPYVRLLVSPEAAGLPHLLPGAADAALRFTQKLWTPILEAGISAGAIRRDLDLPSACEWLVCVQLMLVGRFDAVPQRAAHRELLINFMLPAFVAPA